MTPKGFTSQIEFTEDTWFLDLMESNISFPIHVEHIYNLVLFNDKKYHLLFDNVVFPQWSKLENAKYG